MDDQFDALIAQLPRSKRVSPWRRRFFWITTILALGSAAVMALQFRPPQTTVPRVRFPLAVCGNGIIEPGEDCEQGEPNCPPDCIKPKALKNSQTATTKEQRKGEKKP